MTAPFVIAVCNRKGGSAKTTTAVNLAAEYAARDYRTLLIDLDTQGHAGFGFKVGVERGAPTAHRIFTDADFPLAAALRPTSRDRLWLAPADDLFEVSAGGDPAALARQLATAEITERFDLVVIDTPPSLDITLLAALRPAQGVVVPLQLHPLALEGVKQLIRLLWRVTTGTNPGLTAIGLLPVMINGRIKLQQAVRGEAAARYGPDKLFRGIRSDIALAEAFAAGQPVRDFAPRSRGALDYRLLADEILALWRWDRRAGNQH